MCGRLACYLSGEELCYSCSYIKDNQMIRPIFSNTKSHTYVPLYNISPTSTVPVLLARDTLPKAQQISDDSLLILPMRWGLLPRRIDLSCKASVRIYNQTHNARVENLSPASMFGTELKNNRCVVLCNGYYEWKTTGDKQPFYIYQEKDDESVREVGDWMGEPILKLAGIFSAKYDKDVGINYSCSIITGVADSNLSYLHHRMPIVLNSTRDVEKWIFPNELDHGECFDFIRARGTENLNPPFPLKYHPVKREFVNRSSNNDKRCIERISLKRKNTLDNWLYKRPLKYVSSTPQPILR